MLLSVTKTEAILNNKAQEEANELLSSKIVFFDCTLKKNSIFGLDLNSVLIYIRLKDR